MESIDLARTIVAVGSPLAPARRGIVRISGAMTRDLLAQIFVDESEVATRCETATPQLNAKRAIYFPARIDLDWYGRWIEAGVYYWPNSRSFTGEPCAELHFIGSIPIVDRVVHRLLELGASPAERGEFSLRSFLAGKIDLVQAEAVLGVIESIDGPQLQWALSQLGGNLSRPVRELRDQLVGLLAELEAGLDFVEEDIEFISSAELQRQLDSIIGRIESIAEQLADRGAPLRRPEIALVGLPNAGKSSLLNALVGHERAITSSQAGTTRDAVTTTLELGGANDLSVTLVDTAGIEQLSDGSPRAVAQAILHERVDSCDAIVLCVDSSDLPPPSWIAQQQEWLGGQGRQILCVGTKADLSKFETGTVFDLVVSVHRPDSIQQLRDRLHQIVSVQTSGRFTQATHHTAVRCRLALQRARESLLQAKTLIEMDGGHELVATEFHCALDDLSSIIGQVHNDDILVQIFSRFCIGK